MCYLRRNLSFEGGSVGLGDVCVWGRRRGGGVVVLQEGEQGGEILAGDPWLKNNKYFLQTCKPGKHNCTKMPLDISIYTKLV